jgi:hypothetical protein
MLPTIYVEVRHKGERQGLVMPLWAFLVLVIGGVLLFGAMYELVYRRTKRKIPMNSSEYDKVYAEQMLQDTRDQINGKDIL